MNFSTGLAAVAAFFDRMPKEMAGTMMGTRMVAMVEKQGQDVMNNSERTVAHTIIVMYHHGHGHYHYCTCLIPKIKSNFYKCSIRRCVQLVSQFVWVRSKADQWWLRPIIDIIRLFTREIFPDTSISFNPIVHLSNVCGRL